MAVRGTAEPCGPYELYDRPTIGDYIAGVFLSVMYMWGCDLVLKLEAA
jgi:hypothetical protein